MKWSLAIWCAPVLLAGCRNSPQVVDPFLPSPTVPPPGTGAATSAPYYTPGAAPAASASPYAAPSGTYDYNQPANGPVGTPYQGEIKQYPADRIPMSNRPGGNRQSSNVPADRPKPGAIRSHLASDADPAAQSDRAYAQPAADEGAAEAPASRVVQASHSKVVKVIHSHSSQSDQHAAAPAAAALAAVEHEPRKLPASEDAVDIMDLPPARTASAGAQQARRIASGASSKVIRATHVEPAATSGTSPRRYAYSADYTKLNGQLEYSLAERRWKLRYIPIDGDTDAHGGSVVLVGKVPEGFEAGEFVTVAGRLAGGAAPGEFAPGYQFDTIEPLAD